MAATPPTPPTPPTPAGTRWTEPELLRALSLYRQIPFGRMHRSAPEVVLLATALGRTPSSVAMKLSNYASFDPEHHKRGVGGLANASALDRAVWDAFATDWSRLAEELELPDEAGLARDEPEAQARFPASNEPEARAGIPSPGPPGEVVESSRPEGVSSGLPPSFPDPIPLGPTETDRLVAVRRGQSFFRRTVLSAYETRCCITGLASPALLRASHIVPWTAREDTRLDPHNGLCLNALHDAAFDRGLMTLDEDLRVVYAKALWKDDHTPEAKAMLRQFEGVECRAAVRHGARGEFLEWHREHSFLPA